MDIKSVAIAAIAAIGGAVAASAASAGSLSYDGYGWFGAAIELQAPVSEYAGVGQIQLYNRGRLVADAWCMDVFNYLAGGGTYEIKPFSVATVGGGLLGVPTNLTHDELGEIGALALHGNELLAHGGSWDQSAEIQVAIWTIEHNGAFGYASPGAWFDDGVSTYLGKVGPGSPWGESFGLKFLSGEWNQTLIAASAPEPSTWALMLLGFAGLGYAAYHRTERRAMAI